MNSDSFYNSISEQFTLCECLFPRRDPAIKMKLVAVDLDMPDQQRDSSRYLIYTTPCTCCKQPVTFGVTFGSYNLTGLKAIKAAAEAKYGKKITWSKVKTAAAVVA